ncbi:MAG: hypothetical protein COZ05_07340 [Armatimonadetes bacterium CG_4_10_14_3_um_filter_59_10]|nr:MAG: hypothetical protein COZ05_07340 [Armatimonadetes bacterium CG_4_10_14_3_um_filter_59_10]
MSRCFNRRGKSQPDRHGGTVDMHDLTADLCGRLLDRFWTALPARSSGSVIQICSPQAGDGATTLAIHLSRTWASSATDTRVLLIDAAMRSPFIHRLEGVANAPGLREVLSREVSLAEAIQTVEPGNLSVMSTGAPWQLASCHISQWEALTAQLRAQYTLTLVDSGSLDLESTAAVLGGACDGIVLVVRAGKTQRRAATEAADRLRDTGRVLGVVLNDATVALPRWLRTSFS